jgi:tetratricopeptide (TPR) repeat protein/capsular polysaccharide biosynthesis protein
LKLLLPELHYNLGHVLHQQGDLVKAVAAYRQAIALEPSFVQARHSLAVVLGEQGDYEAAIDYYKQVIALQPHATKAYNNLGCLFVEQGRIAEALQLYRQAMTIEPSATLYINWGKAIAAEDPVAAITAYRRAVELEPDSLSACYNLGHALQQQGQQQAAIECFQRVFQQDGTHAAAHTSCGLAYMTLGQLDSALDHFRQALLPQQDYLDAFCDWANRQQATDELTLARKSCGLFLQTLLQSVERQAEKKLCAQWAEPLQTPRPTNDSDHPDHSDTGQQVQQQLAQTYLHLANVLMQYGGIKQYQQAEIYYQKALQICPQDLEIYLRLGACLSQQQRWNAASLLYHLALTLHPNTPQIYQKLGQLLEQQQRWVEAISYYRQALQANRFHPQPRPIDQRASHCRAARFDQEVDTVERSEFSGFCASTQDWVMQNRSGQYIGLMFDDHHDLVPEQGLWVETTSGHFPQEHASPSTFLMSTNTDQLSCRIASNTNSSESHRPHSACDGLNCNRCLKRVVQQFHPFHLGNGVYICQPETSQSTFRPFVALLPHAQAWMIPCKTDWMITHAVTVLSSDQSILADVSREYPGQLPGCSQSEAERFTQIQQIWQDTHTHVELIPGRVAALAGLSGHNYFHWMVDILPRFAVLQHSGIDLANIDWFWINAPQQPFQQETLHHLGIPSAKILSGDQHPQIEAEQLIVPSFAGNLGWIEPWALKFLRQQFLQLGSAQPQHPHHERIYISRANAHHRRVLNEPAVLEKLRAVGFVSVELETLTLAEQIALFRHAKVVIAPHGGGLTNLLFCSPGTQVVELVTPQYTRHYYWVISQQLGLRHFFLVGSELACAPIQRLMYPSPLMEDIWVNLTALNAVLNHLELK